MDTSQQVTSSMGNSESRKFALIAGFGLLLMTISVGLAEGLVMMNIIVPGDATTTIEHIAAQIKDFRFGIFLHLLVIILDIVVAWALYEFLKPLSNPLNKLTAWWRVVYSMFYAIALVNYFKLAELVKSDRLFIVPDSGFEEFLLDGFYNTWDFGYIFFGLHLAFLGWLLYKTKVVPKWLGILVLVGGTSYLVDYSCKILFANFYPNISLIFGWGELVFMIWLLFWGGKTKKKKEV